MRAWGTGTKAWLLSSALLFGCPIVAVSAQAAQHDRHSHSTAKPAAVSRIQPSGARVTSATGVKVSHAVHLTGKRVVARSYGISCVPYAREVSGILVAGNAWQWWDNAAGLYARGDRPEVGSVLNFRANGRMRLGHVAVVTHVVNAREVIVDHSNWQSGGVSRNVAVVDVSEANNWSAVRVELGHGGAFGSVYPTYGFIYNRADSGIVTASVARPAPQADINPARTDLRPTAERPWHTVEEVAESPATPRQRINLQFTPATASSGQ